MSASDVVIPGSARTATGGLKGDRGPDIVTICMCGGKGMSIAIEGP